MINSDFFCNRAYMYVYYFKLNMTGILWQTFKNCFMARNICTHYIFTMFAKFSHTYMKVGLQYSKWIFFSRMLQFYFKLLLCVVYRRQTGSGWSLMALWMPSGLRTWTPCWMTTRSCVWWVEKSSSWQTPPI